MQRYFNSRNCFTNPSASAPYMRGWGTFMLILVFWLSTGSPLHAQTGLGAASSEPSAIQKNFHFEEFPNFGQSGSRGL